MDTLNPEIQLYQAGDTIKLPTLPQDQYYIYILENDSKRIKIGITHSICNRLRSLSGSNSVGHKMLRCAVGKPTWGRLLETICHERFFHYRIPGTEWFAGVSFDEAVNYLSSLYQSKHYKDFCCRQRSFDLLKEGKSVSLAQIQNLYQKKEKEHAFDLYSNRTKCVYA